ncbi:MAG: Helix-turn-helix domain [Pseudomonadota bacterium]|jgi:cytoskeletal protein RodZ
MTDAADRAFSPFATALRQARAGKSLSIADFARLVQLSDTQVTGLETDDHRPFYSATYAARAARRCAEYLGVDPSLDGAPDEPVQAPVEALSPPVGTIRTRPAMAVKLAWVAVGSVVVTLVVGGFYMARTPGQAPPAATTSHVVAPVAEPVVPDVAPVPETAPAPAEVVSVPAPTLRVPATAVPDDPEHRFYLVVVRPVSIHASDASGSVVISGSLQPDVGQRVVGNPPFAVAVSDEDAVEIYYQGKRIRTERNNNEGLSLSVDPALRSN